MHHQCRRSTKQANSPNDMGPSTVQAISSHRSSQGGPLEANPVGWRLAHQGHGCLADAKSSSQGAQKMVFTSEQLVHSHKGDGCRIERRQRHSYQRRHTSWSEHLHALQSLIQEIRRSFRKLESISLLSREIKNRISPRRQPEHISA